MGKEENLISRITTLVDSNAQFSTKKSQSLRRIREVWPIQRGKKSTEITPVLLKKDLMTDTLDKNFKTTVFKILGN